MRKRQLRLAMAVAAAVLLACDHPTATAPSRRITTQTDALTVGGLVRDPGDPLEDLFVRIAAAVPGFGGYYLDATGRVHLRLKDISARSRVQAELRKAQLGDIADRVDAAEPADFDFIQLKGWRDGLRPVLNDPDMVTLDADEVSNRVVVTVRTEAARPRVLLQIHSIEIPDAAVEIRVNNAFEFAQTLTDYWRPVLPGMGIGDQKGDCTLGPMVQRETGGFQYYLTAGHCMRHLGYLLYTNVFQPDTSTIGQPSVLHRYRSLQSAILSGRKLWH